MARGLLVLAAWGLLLGQPDRFARAGTRLGDDPATKPAAKPSPAATPSPAPEVGRPDGPKAPAGPTLRLNQAVVMGASVSAGFLAQWPVRVPARGDQPEQTRAVPINMADVLGAMSADPAARPASFADQFFFQRPGAVAQRQLDSALAFRPTLVLAIDYLFWHAYGNVLDESDRARRFEEGLARLARLDAPMVVGDLPDMRHAGVMLSPAQVPKPETLAQLNARLAAWASEHPRVVVVPVSRFVADLRAGQALQMAGRTIPIDEARGYFLADALHASPKGLVAVADDMLLRLRAAGLIDSDVTWLNDADEVLARLKPAAVERAEPVKKKGAAEAK
jgi:hypothetical protein